MELLFFGYRGFTSGPDVVLAVTMPGVDGLSLAESLHKTNNVPIMLLTARGAPEDRIAGFEAGADDYLPKPFDPREPRYLQTVRGIGYMLRPGG
jgi:DNA-binding response OmpR family regulator